jgi:predicted dehydrogenase
MVRFAAVGLDHAHIFDHVSGLRAAGAECAGYDPVTTDPNVLKAFRERFPDIPAVVRDRLLDDPSIEVICTAAVPRDRGPIAIEAMRRGKDVMVDKPGCVSLEQLEAIRKTIEETGRIWSVCFSERLCVPAAVLAGKMVADGVIGDVVQTVGLGPHRLNRPVRPEWFFEPAAIGGIINDIASHQVDQFLFYTRSDKGDVVASSVGNFANPENPEFEDFGELLLRSDHATGYIRVDWYTPDGLPVWGDGRLTILGTKGYIELRKYIDIAGRPGGNHLFVANGKSARHIDAGAEPLDYFAKFLADVRDRGETAMPQRHVFETTRLALVAQERAVRLAARKEATK